MYKRPNKAPIHGLMPYAKRVCDKLVIILLHTRERKLFSDISCLRITGSENFMLSKLNEETKKKHLLDKIITLASLQSFFVKTDMCKKRPSNRNMQ